MHQAETSSEMIHMIPRIHIDVLMQKTVTPVR